MDSNETMSLNREFAIHGFVRVTDGRGGLPKVTLTHPSGSHCDVYLDGANILSWAGGGVHSHTPRVCSRRAPPPPRAAATGRRRGLRSLLFRKPLRGTNHRSNHTV